MISVDAVGKGAYYTWRENGEEKGGNERGEEQKEMMGRERKKEREEKGREGKRGRQEKRSEDSILGSLKSLGQKRRAKNHHMVGGKPRKCRLMGP